MAVAGYFLIEGLSQFSGSGAARNMLIVGGVLFQITESLCFISASALTYHSLRWRYILFGLGSILFCFSIAVMTLAQKTALQTGEAQAQANDEKREHIRGQIASLQQVIDSYRLNAEKQSKSIYKDSRALGQDSINRAAELEERKIQLSEELFSLNSARRQTAADFFQRLEEVTGLPGKSTEFYFLVVRSLLLELSGIILMSFGANLRAYNKLVVKAGGLSELEIRKPLLKKLFARLEASASVEPEPLRQTQPLNTHEKHDLNEAKPTAAKALKQTPTPSAAGGNPPTQKKPLPVNNTPTDNGLSGEDYPDKPEYGETSGLPAATATSDNVNGPQLNFLATMVMDLYEQRLLQSLTPVAIKDSLSRYCNQKVTQDTAGILSTLINKRLDETC